MLKAYASVHILHTLLTIFRGIPKAYSLYYIRDRGKEYPLNSTTKSVGLVFYPIYFNLEGIFYQEKRLKIN